MHYAVAGAMRQESIYRTLQVAKAHFADDDVVIIHDARLLASEYISCLAGRLLRDVK